MIEDSSSLKCPVCLSGDTSVRSIVSANAAAQHFVAKEGNTKRNQELCDHIISLWNADDCRIVQCRACGFGFVDPYVAGDETFYRLAYERSNYPKKKWEFDRTVEELYSMSFSADRVLEVGAGSGYFLDKIVGKFVPRSGVTALEYSDPALQSLRGKGYLALQEDLRNVSFHQTFDAIFLFQVVEHMDGLDNLFSVISGLLEDNGSLFIAVPNSKRIEFDEENGSLLDTPPNHIGRSTPRAFQTIGTRHSLKLDRHEIEPFSLLDYIKQDIGYSYLRRSQRKGTLENWARAQRSASYGKLLGAVVAALTAPRRINVWRKAVDAAELGGSLWTKFTKVANG